MAAQLDVLTRLRDDTAVAITATTSETGIEFPIRNQATLDCVISVATIADTADETYVFTVEVSDLVGGTYTAIGTGSYPRTAGSGIMTIPITGQLAEFANATAAFVRVTATLAGTAPSLTYGAWLAPVDVGIDPTVAADLQLRV